MILFLKLLQDDYMRVSINRATPIAGWFMKPSYIYILVGGLEHEFYFSIYWE